MRWRIEQIWRDDGTAVADVPAALAPATVPAGGMLVSRLHIGAHLKVDPIAEDQWLRWAVPAAMGALEEALGRTIVRTQWRYIADLFPENSAPIELPRPPILSVDLVEQKLAGVWTGLAEGVDYETGIGGLWGASVAPYRGGDWPTPDEGADAVRITYTAGIADLAAMPASWRNYLLALISTLNENRETSVAGELPAYVSDLARLLTDRPVVLG